MVENKGKRQENIKKNSINLNSDKEELSKTYSELIVIQVVWLIVSLFIYAGWLYFSNTFQDESMIKWMSFFHILSMVGLLNWFYQGIENYKFITIVNFITKIIPSGGGVTFGEGAGKSPSPFA